MVRSGSRAWCSDTALAALRRWAKLEPELSRLDLDPYLRLAASLRSRVSPETGLPAEVRELAESFSARARRSARPRAPREHEPRPSPRAGALFRRHREEPAGAGEGHRRSAEDAAVAEAMADGLRALDPQRLAGSLVLALVPEKDAQPSVRAVVEEWVESGRLAKGHEAVARKRLNPSEEASS